MSKDLGLRIRDWGLQSAFAGLLLLVLAAGSALCTPFAVSPVIDYTPGLGNGGFSDSSLALHTPVGGLVNFPNSTSVVSLGDHGSITLAFDHDAQDDSRNPYGLDFIVFGNAFFRGGDPAFRWQEPAFVEISQDNSMWYLILPSKLPSNMVGGVDTGDSHTILRGYAEYTPTLACPSNRTNEEFYTVPDRPSNPETSANLPVDAVSGGGDAMDIAWAVVQSAPGVPAPDGQGHTIPAGIAWFRYIRLTDVLEDDTNPTYGRITADIDAVSDIAPAVRIGEAKTLPGGSYAVITDAIVTAAFTGEFYIEAQDRSAAMRVISGASVAIGDRITITGHISKSGGSFVLPDPMFTAVSSNNQVPRPLGAPIARLGSDLSYGLRVRTWGKVIYPGDGYYCIIADGNSAAMVTCPDYFETQQDAYLAVTGVRDREEGLERILIRTSSPDDIRPAGS